ncbi:MAG: mannosyltransferase family protein [bacterium]
MSKFLSRKEWLEISILFVFYRLIIFIFSLVASSRLFVSLDKAYPWIPDNPWLPTYLPDWMTHLIHWDSGWYLSIVEHGYYYTATASNTAFFPLYPLLMKFVSLTGIDPLISGLIISHLTLFGAIIFLYKLANLDLNQKKSLRAVFLLLLFPTAFFFLSVYTESLFLFLIASSFYFARKNKYLLASILAMFSAATRSVGILMLIVLLVEYLEYRNFKFRDIKVNILNLLLIPLGIISYMIFLWNKFGDPLTFINAQKVWSRELGEGIIGFFSTLTTYFNDFLTMLTGGQAYHLANSFDFIAFVLFFVLAIIIAIRFRVSYGLMMVLFLLASSVTGTLISTTRYVIVLFPAFIYLARVLKREYLYIMVLVTSVLLYALFLNMFLNNYWVG